MKRPPLIAMPVRSSSIRTVWGDWKRSRAVRSTAGGNLKRLKSRANTVIPILPIGTQPSSMRPLESFSQAWEPTPIPTEKAARSSVVTCSLPCKTLRE